MNKNPSHVPEPAGDPGATLTRMAKLFDEVQAVKMMSLKHIVHPSGMEEGAAEGDGLKHSQMALKSIEIQLRILAEQLKRSAGAELPLKLAVIWEAITGASTLKPMIGRPPVLDEVIANLKQFAAACEAAGDEGPGEDSARPLATTEAGRD